MLSQENINQLHLNGIYRCEPVLSWLPSYKRDNPYWCKNWTFKVHRYKDKYYMHDTYWSTGDEYPIELTDENFDKFEYLFDGDEIRRVKYSDWIEYPEDDRWRVGLDSGGEKYYIRKNSKKIKERVIERMKYDIDMMKTDLEYKEKILAKIIRGEITEYEWY